MSAAIEILTPRKNAKLERDIGAAKAARYVTVLSPGSDEAMLITSLSDLNDARPRQLLEAIVQQLAELWRPESLAGFVRKVWRVSETLKQPCSGCKVERTRIDGYRADMAGSFERNGVAACWLRICGSPGRARAERSS